MGSTAFGSWRNQSVNSVLIVNMEEPGEAIRLRVCRSAGAVCMRAGRACVALMLVVVIYALSVGPALKLAMRYPRLGEAFEIIYQPVIILCADRFSTSERFYFWYLTAVWRIPMMR